MLLKTSALSGGPTLLVPTLLGYNSFRARLNGDILSIWKCYRVTSYILYIQIPKAAHTTTTSPEVLRKPEWLVDPVESPVPHLFHVLSHLSSSTRGRK